jgi:predicted transcriptional regulator
MRLRRVERAVPGDEDVVAVRAALEEELGDALSVNLAASLLGITHTALARWIKAGDVPAVPTRTGKMNIPIRVVAELAETLAEERKSGHRRRHYLEPTMLKQRARAASIDPESVSEADEGAADRHRRAQRRALAYHRAVARRLRRPMVDDALHQIWKWRRSGRIDERYAEQWEEILRRPVREVRRAIVDESPEADDLRQSSPFAGTLSEPERRRILETVR